MRRYIFHEITISQLFSYGLGMFVQSITSIILLSNTSCAKNANIFRPNDRHANKQSKATSGSKEFGLDIDE